MRYEAILFDFDGVLVDSEPVHYRCWLEILAPYGLSITWDEYESSCIGVSDRAMIQALCRLTGRDELFPAIWADYPRKKAIFRERIVEDVPMSVATRELLRSLDAYRLAVVSSSGRQEIEPALVAAGVRDRFELIVTGEDVRNLKPSPEPYETAARQMNIQRALVVEDSQAGIAAGRAAGFPVVAIPHADRVADLVREHLRDA